MSGRCNRLMWILQKLQGRDYRMFELDTWVSPDRLRSDALILENLGYIKIILGKTDIQNVLSLVKMPTSDELEKAYYNRYREKVLV